jgi:hypothetical protein
MLLHFLQLMLIAVLCGSYGFLLYRRRHAPHMNGIYGRIAAVSGVVLLVGSGIMATFVVVGAFRHLA